MTRRELKFVLLGVGIGLYISAFLIAVTFRDTFTAISAWKPMSVLLLTPLVAIALAFFAIVRKKEISN